MKKPIVITSLAMRFYEKDGWTLEILEPYVLAGKLTRMGKGDQHDPRYYIPSVGTHLNVFHLYNDGHVGELVDKDRWKELRDLTTIQILNERNW